MAMNNKLFGLVSLILLMNAYNRKAKSIKTNENNKIISTINFDNCRVTEKLQATNCICEARDLKLIRPLLMTKNTENLVLNEMKASAWERSKNRWRLRTRQPVAEDY